MTTILGIDAAWTTKRPSGVAVVQQQGTRWKCIAIAPSYASFIELAQSRSPDWTRSPSGSSPNPHKLLCASTRLAGETPALITLDMPVATVPILGRRMADREVSRIFGSRWCSAHSSGPARPGPLGVQLACGFAEAGYPIATANTQCGTMHRVVEVYPHPALLTLLRRDRRVPYKVDKTSKYWKGIPLVDRIERILTEFSGILAGLENFIDDIPIALPGASQDRTLAALKPIEDAIDALICCWVGIEYLAGRCHPLGDETAAIWCPDS